MNRLRQGRYLFELNSGLNSISIRGRTQFRLNISKHLAVSFKRTVNSKIRVALSIKSKKNTRFIFRSRVQDSLIFMNPLHDSMLNVALKQTETAALL